MNYINCINYHRLTVQRAAGRCIDRYCRFSRSSRFSRFSRYKSMVSVLSLSLSIAHRGFDCQTRQSLFHLISSKLKTFPSQTSSIGSHQVGQRVPSVPQSNRPMGIHIPLFRLLTLTHTPHLTTHHSSDPTPYHSSLLCFSVALEQIQSQRPENP